MPESKKSSKSPSAKSSRLGLFLLFFGFVSVTIGLILFAEPSRLTSVRGLSGQEENIRSEIFENTSTVKDYFEVGKVKVLAGPKFKQTNQKHIENLKTLLLSQNKQSGDFILEIQFIEDPEDSLSFLKATVQLSLFSEKTGNKIWEHSFKVSAPSK